MFKKAMDLQNNGALNDALEIYQKLLTITPENSDIWNLMGCIAQSKGDDKKAVDCFLSAIKYSPRPFGMYYFNLSLSYKALSKKSEAIEMMVKASSLLKDCKEIWNYRGVLEAELGDIKSAIDSFCKALEIDINYKEARANLCFYSNDKEKLLEIANNDELDFYANFLAGSMVCDLDEKERFFRRAYNNDYGRFDVLLALACVLREKNNESEALTFYHKVLNLDENNIEALLGLADIYLKQKNYEKAEKYYRKSLEEGAESVGLYLNFGALLYETKRYNEALEIYRKAVKCDPSNALISYNLALILKEIQDFEEALGLMFNAHLLEPQKDEFVIGIMESLFELYRNNPELALKIAQNWQKLDENNIFSKRILQGMTLSDDVMEDTEYAKKLFDVFSDTYDATLDKLESKIIDKFSELKGDIGGRILDLGCGTGNVGEKLKNDKCLFFGVDVSSKMIEKARLKGVYEELYCGDILGFLTDNDLKKYDLVLAMDVFSYIGNLESLLEKLKGREIWFSVEKADDNISKNFYLTPSGRYKHKLSYIKALKNKLNFNEFDAFELDLRLENSEAVEGFLIRLK